MPVRAREYETLSLARSGDGIAEVAFAVPGSRHNLLSAAVLVDLAAVLDELDAGPAPRGLVLRSGRPGSFFAGADVGRVDETLGMTPAEIEARCAIGRTLFARLSATPWPSVAVIDGVCLGGGLELALACDLRVATDAPHTLLGLPEVKLGLLPGWGGTVRLPRLVGPGPAVEFACGGESIDGRAAWRLGLVDACVAADRAGESARRLVDLHGGNARSTAGLVGRRRAQQAAPIGIDPEERAFLEASTAAVVLGRTGGHYPAPMTILQTILAGATVSASEAGSMESAAFARLARTPVARQLVRVFRIGERNKRDSGVEDGARADGFVAASPAVVGAGIMGAGIAGAHLRSGMPVTLVDVNAETLAASVPGILDEAAWDRAAKRTDPARALALAGGLRTGTRLAAIAGCDIVIESVAERTDVKQQVLAEIERTVGPDTIVATNTSTNPITRLAEVFADPGRFCGIHFFNPVRRMTLVEVVRGPVTSDRTVTRAVAHVKRLGKCPIVVRDSPGFLVNRVLMPYLHESVELVRDGVAPERVDRIARSFGMPMGPLELYDLIGLDTAFYAGLVLSAAFGDRVEASPVIPALVKAGRLGRKSGAGFYAYTAAATRPRLLGPDPTAAEIVLRYAPEHRSAAPSDRTIADRLFLPMLLEALRTLDEGIVRDAADIDLAVIHALGFPAFRGGLLAWADTLGADEVLRRPEPLADLGPRMHPTDSLRARARAGRSFTS